MNLRAEWTWSWTDEELPSAMLVAVHTCEPLSFVIAFIMVKFPPLIMIPEIGRLPSDLLHVTTGLYCPVTLHISSRDFLLQQMPSEML